MGNNFKHSNLKSQPKTCPWASPGVAGEALSLRVQSVVLCTLHLSACLSASHRPVALEIKRPSTVFAFTWFVHPSRRSVWVSGGRDNRYLRTMMMFVVPETEGINYLAETRFK